MKAKRYRTLREWREASQLTQSEAAGLVGLQQSQWSQYERGEHVPRKLMLRKLREVTGVPLEVLAGLE